MSAASKKPLDRIRRFDVFAEYQKQAHHDDGMPLDKAKGYGLWVAKVVAARNALFGSWETNWLAYNFAHDVALPGSDGPRLGFLMYPQAETASMRLDCLNADSLKYVITSRELTAT